jgi:hypothetical protein
MPTTHELRDAHQHLVRCGCASGVKLGLCATATWLTLPPAALAEHNTITDTYCPGHTSVTAMIKGFCALIQNRKCHGSAAGHAPVMHLSNRLWSPSLQLPCAESHRQQFHLYLTTCLAWLPCDNMQAEKTAFGGLILLAFKSNRHSSSRHSIASLMLHQWTSNAAEICSLLLGTTKYQCPNIQNPIGLLPAATLQPRVVATPAGMLVIAHNNARTLNCQPHKSGLTS